MPKSLSARTILVSLASIASPGFVGCGPESQFQSSSLPCWDLNGDGTATNDEDVNRDGEWDTLDCRGPACWDADGDGYGDPEEDVDNNQVHDANDCVGASGPDGPLGPQGNPGTTGAVGPSGASGIGGLNCWDLDGSGVQDPNEDVNNDGAWDASDCTGPAGLAGADGLDGTDGPPGVDGLACWDADADSFQDPFEDLNGDGVWDAADCLGPQGAQGPQGEPGLQGATGARGISCWDTDSDGAADLVEDMNLDGQWDSRDCVGATGASGSDGLDGGAGPAGVHCWDLDANGLQDPVEDKNGDALVDVSDCQCQDGIDGVDGIDGQNCWDADGDGIQDSSEDTNEDGMWDSVDCQGPAGPTGPPGAGGADLFDAVVDAGGGADFTDIASAFGSGARSVWVKSGNYVLSATLNLGDDARLEGDSRTTVSVSFAGCAVMIAGGSGNQIRNLDIQRPSACISEAIGLTSDSIVENVSVVSGGFGISVGAGSRVARSIVSAQSYALLISGASWIDGNTISATNSAAIYPVDTTGSRITGNDITVTAGHGVIGAPNMVIVANILTSTDPNYVAISAGGGSTVDGNTIVGFGRGIVVDGRNLGSSVTNNKVEGTMQAGIEVDGGSNIDAGGMTVNGNTVQFTGGDGIVMKNLGVNVNGNAVRAAGGACYIVPEYLENSTISGNRAYECVGVSYDLYNVRSSSVVGNSADLSGSTAFSLTALSGSAVQANVTGAFGGNRDFDVSGGGFFEVTFVGNKGVLVGAFPVTCTEAANIW